VVPGSTVLCGSEGICLGRARGNGTVGNTVDTVMDIALELTETVPVDAGASKYHVSLASLTTLRSFMLTHPLTGRLFLIVTEMVSPQFANKVGPGNWPLTSWA
jgi:hypothetical protein